MVVQPYHPHLLAAGAEGDSNSTADIDRCTPPCATVQVGANIQKYHMKGRHVLAVIFAVLGFRCRALAATRTAHRTQPSMEQLSLNDITQTQRKRGIPTSKAARRSTSRFSPVEPVEPGPGP